MEPKKIMLGVLVVAAIAFAGFLSVPYIFPETESYVPPANVYDLAYSSSVKAAGEVCTFQWSTGHFVSGQVIMYDRVKSAADSVFSTFRCYPGLAEYAECGLKSAQITEDMEGSFVTMCNVQRECAITLIPGEYSAALYENIQKPSGC